MKYLLDIQDNQSAFAEAFFKTISFIKKVTPISSNNALDFDNPLKQETDQNNDSQIINKIAKSWTKEDVADFKTATATFETIEKELW